jgi:hypothetical protein
VLVDDRDAEPGGVARVDAVDGLARNTIDPASGRIVPVATFISVDLPAPFSPSSAWTSPGRTSRETSVSAATPPKLFEMSDMTSVATVVGASAAWMFT